MSPRTGQTVQSQFLKTSDSFSTICGQARLQSFPIDHNQKPPFLFHNRLAASPVHARRLCLYLLSHFHHPLFCRTLE